MKAEQALVMIAAAVGLSACAPGADVTATPQGTIRPGASLTPEQLLDATYSLPDGRKVTLHRGSYEEKPDPNAATFVTKITVAEDLIAFGDLDGDGDGDASVVLFDSPGGSGVFGYLALMLNVDGLPVNADTAELGDRTQVHSNAIADGLIELAVTAHAPDDPLCCPTNKARWGFALVSGELVRAGVSTPR